MLVFEFDVLMSYAVTSMLVAYLIGRSDRAVRAWVIAAATLHVALVALLTVALMAAPAEQAPVASDLFARGSYPDQVAARLDQALPYRAEGIFIIPLGVVLFLLGSRLLRAGAFEDSARGARLRVRLMAVGFGIGVPLNVLSTLGGVDWFLVDRYLSCYVLQNVVAGAATAGDSGWPRVSPTPARGGWWAPGPGSAC